MAMYNSLSQVSTVKLGSCVFDIKRINPVFLGEEQQEDSHTGEGGERQEEVVPGAPAQYGQTAQTGGLRRHQEEV